MENSKNISTELSSKSEDFRSIQIISEKAFHDFKNIIATISGIAQLTMMKTKSEELRSNLYSINQATLTLQESLDRYYDVTKDFCNYDLSACSIPDNINTVLKIVKYKFDLQDMINRPIKMNLEVESNAKVLCNDYELKQCFLNIIMNSIDSMEENGGKLSIRIWDEGHFTYVEIVDSGAGISQENLDRLFKETFTTKEKGTGLGLRITKYIVEKYGGHIQISSQLGIGTEVRISLPICREF